LVDEEGGGALSCWRGGVVSSFFYFSLVLTK
jgi:hypothetical protein